MLDDMDRESIVGPPSSTIWIETELRRLYKESHEWQARWRLLKDWLASRQNTDENESTAGDCATLDMVISYMCEMENETPVWNPKCIPHSNIR